MTTITKLAKIVGAVRQMHQVNGKTISEITGLSESDISRLGKAAILNGFLEKPNGKYNLGRLCRTGG